MLATVSLLASFSLLGFAPVGENDGYFPAVLISLLIHAVGIAMVFAPRTVAIMQGMRDAHAGAASGLLPMDQQIVGALGVAVITSIYAFAFEPGSYVGLVSSVRRRRRDRPRGGSRGLDCHSRANKATLSSPPAEPGALR